MHVVKKKRKSISKALKKKKKAEDRCQKKKALFLVQLEGMCQEKMKEAKTLSLLVLLSV